MIQIEFYNSGNPRNRILTCSMIRVSGSSWMPNLFTSGMFENVYDTKESRWITLAEWKPGDSSKFRVFLVDTFERTILMSEPVHLLPTRLKIEDDLTVTVDADQIEDRSIKSTFTIRNWVAAAPAEF